MSIALVAANFGAIDPIHPLPDHSGIDAFYYTDSPIDGGNWKTIRPNYPRYDFDNRLRAKYFKLQIHRLSEVKNHRWLVWNDSSLRYHSDISFINAWTKRLEALPKHQHALFIPHPDRTTISEEFLFIMERMRLGDQYLISRYAKEHMMEQIADIGEDGKLWCGGFWIVENTPLYHNFLNDWWDHSLKFGIMDQLPIPSLFKKHGIDPQVFPVNTYLNQYWRWTRNDKKA